MSIFNRRKKIQIHPVGSVVSGWSGSIVVNHCWRCGCIVHGNGQVFHFDNAGYRLCDNCYSALMCRIFSKDW